MNENLAMNVYDSLQDVVTDDNHIVLVLADGSAIVIKVGESIEVAAGLWNFQKHTVN